MKQNAPLYGWFHPAWAERARVHCPSRGTGSMPVEHRCGSH